MRWRRRLLVLILAAAVVAAARARRRPATGASPPEWPPLADTGRADPAPPAVAAVSPPVWVEPVDGGCPPGYPVKANDNSGIFHVPGGRFYDRTKPERCYATSADAERDGYRAAKA